MAKVNLDQTRPRHVSESYTFQLYQNAQVNQDMKILFVWSRKGFGQKSQNLDCENKRIELKVEILRNPNNVCECIIALYSFSTSKEKID